MIKISGSIELTYSRILRRLREKKTNYRRRKALLMSRRDFVTVHISNENTSVQIHKPELTGDKVVASAHSRTLMGKGWKGSRKNIPAAYLKRVLFYTVAQENILKEWQLP